MIKMIQCFEVSIEFNFAKGILLSHGLILQRINGERLRRFNL